MQNRGAPAALPGDVITKPDVQTFTANGTWTKPAGATTVQVLCIGGGGSGGAGRRGPSGTGQGGGGGGGGGGGYQYSSDAVQYPAGGTGQTGGSGGAGKDGVRGTDGDDGGTGGRGGGGVQIVAEGSLVFGTSTIGVQGAAGGNAETTSVAGVAASTVRNAGGNASGNIGAESAGSYSGANGGVGGKGAAGGLGGGGGSGGGGAGGNGGAGGTVFLSASDLRAQGLTVDAAGGAGGTGASAGKTGANGRLVELSNTGLVGSGSSVSSIAGSAQATNVGTTTLQGGATFANGFINSAYTLLGTYPETVTTPTPKLGGLVGGADVAGLLKLDITDAKKLAEALNPVKSGNAAAALAVVRLAPGTSVAGITNSYTNYDMVLVVNLTDIALSNPKLGIVDQATRYDQVYQTPLALAVANPGFSKALSVGGVTQQGTLPALNAYGVYATLVTKGGSYTVTASADGLAAVSPTVLPVTGASSPLLVSFAPQTNPTTSLPGFDAVARLNSGGPIYGISTATGSLSVVDPVTLVQTQFLSNGRNGVSGLAGASAIAVSPDGTAVYVASATGHTLASFTRDTGTGALTFKQSINVSRNVLSTLVAVNGDGVIGSGADGSVQFTRSGTTVQTTGAGTTYVPVTQAVGVVAAARGPTGTLLAAAGPAGVTAAVSGNDGSTLLVAAGGTIDRLTETTPTTGQGDTRLVSGLAPVSAMALGAGGTTLYAASGSAASLTVVSITATGGTVRQVLQSGTNGVTGLAGASAVTVLKDANGADQYVVVSAAGGNALAVFAVDATKGLVFNQLLRNGTGGAAGLDHPGTVLATGAGTALVATAGAQNSAGGLTRLTIASVAPAPAELLTGFSGMASVGLSTGSGDDSVALLKAPTAGPTGTATLRIATGAGNDTVSVQALSATTTVDLGAGNDMADVRAGTADAALTLSGGAGSDRINVLKAGDRSVITVDGGAAANRTAADGSDVVTLDVSGISASATVTLHGDGQDTATGDRLLVSSPASNTVLDRTAGTATTTVTSTTKSTVRFDGFEDVRLIAAPGIVITVPASLPEGGALTATATVTANGATGTLSGPVLWDISGHGNFGEATGPTITLSWAQLTEFGIAGPGSYQIAARATNADGLTATMFATLTVTAVAPVVTVAVPATGTLGTPVKITFAAVEAGNALVKGWTVAWGDGTTDSYGSNATGAAHGYADVGAKAVVVTLVDSTGSFVQAARTVAVTVDPASVTAGGPYTIAQGQALVLSGTAPGTPTYSWTVNGDTARVFSGSPVTVSWASLQGLGKAVGDPGNYDVLLTALYSDGEKVQVKAPLTVTEVAPTVVAASGGPVVQGNAGSLVLTIGSPSAQTQARPYDVSYSVDGGTARRGSVTVDPRTGTASLTVPASAIADHGTHVVTGTVTDAFKGVTAFSTQITVTAVAEVLTATGASTVAEGSPYALTLSASHPAPQSVQYWIVDWRDGVVQRFDGTSVVAAHVYGETTAAGQPHVLGITAYDQDGATTVAAPPAVAVTAVAPTLALNPVQTVTVGNLTHVSGTAGSAGANNSYTVTVSWGDGTSTAAAVTQRSPQFDFVHTYATFGSFAVSAAAVDRDGGTARAAATAVVAGAPLAMGAVGFDRSSIPEGGFVLLLADKDGNPAGQSILPATLSGILVPTRASDTASVTIDWGDGTSSAAAVDQKAHSYTASHIYRDNPAGQPNGLYTATVTATDGGGVSASTTASIQVTNAAPVLTAFAPAAGAIDEGGTATVTGAFTDPGTADTHGVTIGWGDGTSSAATVDEARGTFTASHAFLNNLAYVNGVPGAYQVTATLVDKDGGSASRTTQQVVNNVAPALTALMITTGAPTEFNPVTLTGHVTDPGTLDVHTLQVAWGDGTVGTVTVDPVFHDFTATHTYTEILPPGQAGTSHVITLTASDGAASGTATLPVSLRAARVAVAGLSASPGTVAEGGATVVSGSFTDDAPGTAHSVTVDFGDGTSAVATVNEATRSFSAGHTYANNPGTGAQGAYTVTATAANGLGLSGQAVTAVTVADVAPTLSGVTLSRTAIIEGGSVTLTGQVVDPGLADGETVSVSWGDGTTAIAALDPATRLFTATHVYADNPAGQPNGSFVIGVTVTDDSGLSGSAAASVAVSNAAPVVSGLVLPGSVAAGAAVTLTGSVSDAGVRDTETVTVDWGDGTSSAAAFNAGTGVFTASHVYAAASAAQPGGAFAVVATATDKDGGQGSATASIAVTAPPVPAPVLSGLSVSAAAIKEGDTVSLTGTLLNAAAGHTLTVAWGDGQTGVYRLTAGGIGFTVAHTYANNPAGGATTVTASLSNGVDPASSATTSVTVANVAPVWTGLSNSSTAAAKTPVGQSVVFHGSFTDPGALDTHTVTVGWGDGSKASTYTMSAGVLAFDYGHVYAKAGTYYVTVQVTDADGAVSGYRAAYAYIGPAVANYVPPVAATVPDTQAAVPVPATTTTKPGPVIALTPAPAPLTAVTPSSSGKAPGATVMSGLAFGRTDEPLIALIKSSQVRLAVNAPQPFTVPSKPANLVFDPATGEFTEAGAAPAALASIDLGEDWTFLPAVIRPHAAA